MNPGSAAEGAGIRPGDVILVVDGVTLNEPRELMDLLAPMRAGRNIAVTVQRDSRQVTLSLSLKERPRDRGVNFEVLYHHVVSGGSRIRTLVSRSDKAGPPCRVLLHRRHGAGEHRRAAERPECREQDCQRVR